MCFYLAAVLPGCAVHVEKTQLVKGSWQPAKGMVESTETFCWVPTEALLLLIKGNKVYCQKGV